MSNLEANDGLLNTQKSYVEVLRTKRFEYTLQAVKESLSWRLSKVATQGCELGFLQEAGGDSIIDEGNPSINTLTTLEILGLRQELFEYLTDSSASSAAKRFDLENGEWIEVQPYSNGFAFRKGTLTDTIQFVRRSLGDLNTFKAIDSLIAQSNSNLEIVMSNIEIDLNEEGIFLLKILSDLGANLTDIEDISKLNILPIDQANLLVERYLFDNSVVNKKAVKTFIEGKEAYVFTVSKGYSIIVIKDGTKCRIGYNISSMAAYFETPNQLAGHPSLPFIETLTARDLLGEFSRVGLEFNQDIERIMVEVSESDRYGNVATHITREISKLVNDNKRSIAELFKDTSDLFKKIGLLEESGVQDKIARIIIQILKNLVNRQNDKDDLIATQQYVSMRDGSCFDSVDYFEQAQIYGDLEIIVVNGKRLLYKKHGAKTYLNLDTLIFNGVEIPAGGLFIKPLSSKSDEFALVRLTPYADLKTDPLYGAFAPEVTKAKINNDSIRAKRGLESPVTRLSDFASIYF